MIELRRVDKQLDFREYQQLARKTAIYPSLGHNFVYPTLGLAGEAGEVVEVIKKFIRDNEGNITPEIRSRLSGELGDLLWYIANLAVEVDISLDDIASSNILKLTSRANRGKLHGSGEDR